MPRIQTLLSPVLEFSKQYYAVLEKHPLVKRFSAVILALGAVLFVGLLTLWPLWRAAESTEFDLLSVTSASYAPQLPIVIVGIDDNSFQVLERQWPWPRSWHAKLIDALKAEGAAVVAFDVIFDQPADNPAEDDALTAAIKNSGNIVLATHEVVQELRYGVATIEQRPLPRFVEAGARVGKITMAAETDRVIRSQPPSEIAMWREVVKLMADRFPDINLKPDLTISKDRRIRYLGPPNTFRYISFTEIIDPREDQPKLMLPAGTLKDKIVLVGRTTLAAATLGGQTDTFPTPFTMTTKQLMPGVELHATLIEGAITRDTLRESSRLWVWLVVCLSSLGLAFLSQKLKIVWLPALWLGSVILLMVSGWMSYALAGWWVPIAPAIAATTIVFLLRFWLVYMAERRNRLAIRKMFTLYVPPKLVAELEARPESLSLGGSQREITIMFTDLAGFTTIAEAMPPLEVSNLLNRYFSVMTRIVFDNNGTLDKFIGDAIMAFWGAPLDDPDQAKHAILCASQIQAATVELNKQFVEMGFPPLTTRIGVHSGTAVVGNLGSPERFSYTALGDNVNLAARLEGANKAYGTHILLSGSSAKAGEGNLPLRRVDRVRVKGKTQAVDLYTPCDDSWLIDATEKAWQPYVTGNWEEARTIWQNIHKRWPDDTVAATFLERLANPVPADWDGGWTMDSK